ncbi:MAG: hypothetical protein H7Z13_08545 [Ferruginibacter sp.]|nr:hypothetical protein [Ferruginibacter sp.]
MLEIIALIFLCKMNGKLATQKGLKAGTWKGYTVLAWIVAEMIGVILGIILCGQENLIAIMLLALVSAFGGYLFIKAVLDKKPDSFEEEINSIGVDDLQPPRK